MLALLTTIRRCLSRGEYAGYFSILRNHERIFIRTSRRFYEATIASPHDQPPDRAHLALILSQVRRRAALPQSHASSLAACRSMTKERRLSQYQSFIVNNLREQSRIMAQIASLEAGPDRGNKSLAAARQIGDLRAELLALQLAINAHIETNTNSRREDIATAVPAPRRKGAKAQNTRSEFGRATGGSPQAVCDT